MNTVNDVMTTLFELSDVQKKLNVKLESLTEVQSKYTTIPPALNAANAAIGKYQKILQAGKQDAISKIDDVIKVKSEFVSYCEKALTSLKSVLTSVAGIPNAEKAVKVEMDYITDLKDKEDRSIQNWKKVKESDLSEVKTSYS